MDIKMVVCDLDGTLLDRSSKPHVQAAQLLGELPRLGIQPVLATGRSWRTAVKVQQALDITGPLVAHNGAYAFDTVTRQDWYRRSVPKEVAREMFRWADQHQAMLRCYLGMNHPVVFNRFSEEHLASWLRAEDRVVPNLAESLHVDPLEIFVFGHVLAEQFLAQFGQYGPDYECAVFLHPGYKEINVCAPGVDKVEGLAVLAERLGVAPENVLAIGDGLNDVEMLSWAGIGVAVGDGAPEAQAAASLVTPPGMSDPVAWTLLHFFGAHLPNAPFHAGGSA